jgi:hypothetical protein
MSTLKLLLARKHALNKLQYHSLSDSVLAKTVMRKSCGRRHSSLGNPMFPEAPIKIQGGGSQKSAGTGGPSDEGFLSKHGGKVAIVAIGISIGLIYSYILSGRSRNLVEDSLNSEASLEPYEVTAFLLIIIISHK